MLKWLVTLLVGLVILAALTPRLRRLPGDFRIPLRGRMYYVPLASTILLSLIVWGLSRLI